MLLVYYVGRQAECGAEKREKQTLEVGDWGDALVGGPGLMCQSQCVGCVTTIWTNPRLFSCIKNKERCQSSQISAYSLCYPISKNNLRQFYLGAVLPGGSSTCSESFTLYFFPKRVDLS